MKYQVGEITIDFKDMDEKFYLIGLLNEFMNKYQTVADHFLQEISWKQCFLLACIGVFCEPPTLKEVSGLMGCSHQNVKQMLLKMEKKGYVKLIPDENDRRKQRIIVTQKAESFCNESDEPSKVYVKQLFQEVEEDELNITIRTMLKLDDQLQKMKEGE